MSFLVSFFNSSSARNESSNEAEYNQEADPSMNLQTQMEHVAGTVQSPQLLATQLEPSNYVHFQDTIPEPLSRGNPVEESAARAVPMPARNSFHGGRMRSLSKVFTSLPDKPLPSYAQMVVDQIEFLMHVILLETDPNRAIDHQNNLLQAVDVFRNNVPTGKELMQSGRLYSRMMLTSLACDLITLNSKGNEEENAPQASELPAEGWRTMKERLISLKNLLLKQNSNAAIDFSGDAEVPLHTVDEQLACHEMMTVDFDELTLLFSVHEEIAFFKEQLENCIAQEQEGKSTSLDTIPKNINKAVETCVNSFMKNLSVIFPPEETTPEEEVDDGIEIEEELDESWGRKISNIPKELHVLALTELYSPKLQPQSTSLVDRLLTDIHSITVESQIPSASLPGRFSFTALLSKTRSLLTKWSETILEIPTLVQLGYCGVPSPFVFKDDDDVSSWGSEGEYGGNADEKIVRSRSFSRILRASIQGRPVSVSVEEKDLIARLASIAESFSHAHASVASGKDLARREAAFSVTEDGKRPEISPNKESVTNAPINPFIQSNESPLEVNASTEQRINENGIAAAKASVSTAPNDPDETSFDFPPLDQQADISTPSTGRRGRKVLKAGRRFLSSLSAMAQRISDDADDAAGSARKKRTAEKDVSSLAKPAKVSRRNNTWAFNQRKKGRLSTNDSSREAVLDDVNNLLSFQGNGGQNNQTLSRATPKKAVVVEDDEGTMVRTPIIGSPASSSIKRHPFTEDEMNAIIEGVKLHGVGHWTVIQESDERLANRRPGQLKDKYRTMQTRGEI